MLLLLLSLLNASVVADMSSCDEESCASISLLQNTASIVLSNTQKAPADMATLVRDGDAEHASKLPKHMRPNIATRHHDSVEYGVLIKSCYGLDFGGNSFTVDAVTSVRWFDARTIALLPKDVASLRVSSEEAAAMMWLPDVRPSNRAPLGIDIISSSVLVMADGTVTQTERAIVTLNSVFKTVDFPLDTQNLEVRLASSTYMLNEVHLVPTQDSKLWGAGESVFNNSAWSLVDASLHSIFDTDGSLEKSRGVLTLTVKRDPSQFVSNVIMPSCLLLVMTWMALWFPLTTPFVNPRVGACAIAFLSMLTLSNRVDSMTAPTGMTTLMDSYLEMCLWLQFAYLLVNGGLAAIAHRNGHAEFAAKLDVELIFSFPVALVLFLGFGWFRPYSMWVGRCLAVSVITLFIVVNGVRLKRFDADHPELDVKASTLSGAK
jgi:hypothetical protein